MLRFRLQSQRGRSTCLLVLDCSVSLAWLVCESLVWQFNELRTLAQLKRGSVALAVSGGTDRTVYRRHVMVETYS
ncbi:hypothetical protein B0T24DRAFT_638220 [Lasiosphaeria ovina]|uniref:Uncharacterized protein n=1 Tax=Lasiosphaeria ovina TaxID=92902 RepID=A0AAE0N0X5_9PEZI|nr:hypothetical protein B0T24DRAFT_638220 [Lasiosphaeria ovina]